MCKSKTNLARWMSLCALVATIAIFTPAAAWGAIQMSSGPAYPLSLVAGQTNVPVQYFIGNSGNSTSAITIDTGSVRYAPICSNPTYGPTGTAFPGCQSIFGGVGPILVSSALAITPSATGTGVVPNPGCAQTWTFTFIDNNQGYSVTAPNPLSLAAGESCEIDFTINVNAATAAGSYSATGYATANTNAASGSGSSPFDLLVCAAQVDKQVSCDGTNWTDQGLVSNNEDGTGSLVCPLDGFNGVPSNVHFQYFAKNTGGVAMTCGFTDTQNKVGGVTGPGGLTIFTLNAAQSLAVGAATSTQLTNGTDTTQACTSTFASNEANTGLLTCTCSTTTNDIHVTASDQATVDCKSAGVSLTKNCADQVNGLNHVTFTASNVGNVDATACTITDTFYPTALTCPPGGTDVGSTATVNGGVFGLAVGDSNITTPDTADIDSSLLTANYCNTAHLSCTVGAATATADSSTVCNVPPPPPGSCISRTPGYWGTHPNQTDSVINDSLTVCGITLTGFGAPLASNSAVEDLCESNQDANSNNVKRTSDQQLQLIRQCTAAAINLQLSGDGSITAGETACSAFPTIATTFGNCCVGPTSTCDSGASVAAINASGCIGTLDAFNNQFDNVSFPTGFVNEPAKPTACGIATGNHWVNPGRNLGAAANGK